MHNPIDILYAEHEVILNAEKIISNLDHQWERDAGHYLTTVRTLVVFFKEYADGFHHHKEEQVLFPAIINHDDFTIPEMVESLLHHHEEFRGYAAGILQALEEADYAGSYKLLTQYMLDLSDHISAEDDELFVLAGNLFDQDQLESIYFRFKDIDIEIGEDKKEALEAMIISL